MKHITILSLLFIISGNLSMVTEYKRDPLKSKWVTQELLLINQNSFSMAFCCKWSKGKRLIDSFFTFFPFVVVVTHKVFFSYPASAWHIYMIHHTYPLYLVKSFWNGRDSNYKTNISFHYFSLHSNYALHYKFSMSHEHENVMTKLVFIFNDTTVIKYQ